MMNNQELLKACLEKIELYHAAMKAEYPGGMPNQVLLPALREAIQKPQPEVATKQVAFEGAPIGSTTRTFTLPVEPEGMTLTDDQLWQLVRVYHGFSTDEEMVEALDYSLELYVAKMRLAFASLR